jgi:hypothetical protein
MHVHKRVTAGIAAALLAGGFLAAGSPANAEQVPLGAASPAAGASTAEPVAGTGTAAAARSVTVQSVPASQAVAAGGVPAPVLGKNGKPAGPSGVAPATSPSSRPAPSPAPNQPGGPNTGNATQAKLSAGLQSAALSDSPAFSGANQASSDCSGCTAVPYDTAAVSDVQIAETVDLSLQVFSKSGTLECAESLTSLLGAYGGLTEPRIQYDNSADRFSLVISTNPSSSSTVPVFYLATSQTDNACGAWWVYQIILSGSQYPLGAQMNYPYLGQDNTSLLASTNNFTYGLSYLGTGAFAMPKAAAYTGNPFNITTYSVDFSTAPAVVAGIPTFATTTTYWVAAVPGEGFDVFSMPTNPAGAISFVGTAEWSYNPPSRMIRQPGTGDTLNPLDGRLQTAVVQDGNLVWFANDISDNGFPTVMYGAIDVINGDIDAALAYHDGTSDDFSPSIGVSDQGSGTVAIWLNWAYTDTANGVPVSDTINGVGPGDGVPNLTSSDLTLTTGTSYTGASNTTFGAYSSVEVDPVANGSCPAGLTALSAQEYFSSASQWSTVLARTNFC